MPATVRLNAAASAICAGLALGLAPGSLGSQGAALTRSQTARIDSVFVAYDATDVPGCAVAISRHDTLLFDNAWGMANLEQSIPNTPETFFESGSVAKQFTAAAILRLAQQGKLSLDDEVRKYVPELPVYDAPITIRHLINHTSGLRDWGVLVAIGGWTRGTRAYTHAHVLDMIGKQRSLNFPVGTQYLYSNSNYSLLAIIAERVSGKTLAEYTKAELFDPLGMTHTSWRDDYQRIVPGRAQAYAGDGKSWRLSMPFESTYGHAGVLTTVGDLLKWNANLASKRVGGEQFIAMETTRGRLKDGREIKYAAGLVIDTFQGLTEIKHDGFTAGYRAYLARYPEPGIAVAMLCNAANVNPTDMARRVAAVVLPPYTPAVSPADTIRRKLSAAQLASIQGYYRASKSDDPLHFIGADGRLLMTNGPLFLPLSPTHFISVTGSTHLLFDRARRGSMRAWTEGFDSVEYVRVDPPRDGGSFGEYAGKFISDEADAILAIAWEANGLTMKRPSATKVSMTPIYEDGFWAQGYYVKFTRGKDRKVNGLLITAGGVRNLRFDKMKASYRASVSTRFTRLPFRSSLPIEVREGGSTV